MKAKIKNNKTKKMTLTERLLKNFKLLLIPHKHNDYRPHLIRSYGLVAVVFVVIGIQAGYNMTASGSVLGYTSDITISSLLDKTNIERTNDGQSQLVLNDKLIDAAYLKAKNMFAEQYWSHDSPDGVKPWKWFSDVEYNYDMAGENLALNFTSTDAVMTAWMNSPEHKLNIINKDYKDVGFAIVSGTLKNKSATIIVAMYGLSAQDAVLGVSQSLLAPNGQINIFTQFAVIAKTISPAAIVGVFILILTMAVAILAHFHRLKLPIKLKRSWYRHHGLYKFIGLGVVLLSVIVFYSSGQI